MNKQVKEAAAFLRQYWYLLLPILLGVALMLRPAPESGQAAAAADPSNQFAAETEARLVEMLSGIEGAGNCRVTVTLASGGRKEYAREGGDVLVIRDKNGNQEPVLVRESVPEIAGVTVASRGAGSAAVRAEIIRAVSTVLGIGTNKICVVSLSEG